LVSSVRSIHSSCDSALSPKRAIAYLPRILREFIAIV
jgi:hypothetical protein